MCVSVPLFGPVGIRTVSRPRDDTTETNQGGPLGPRTPTSFDWDLPGPLQRPGRSGTETRNKVPRLTGETRVWTEFHPAPGRVGRVSIGSPHVSCPSVSQVPGGRLPHSDSSPTTLDSFLG